MRRTGWVVLGAAALLIVQAGCTAGSLTEEQRAGVAEELDGFVGTLFEAMNAHDVDAISSHYENSPEFVYVGCTTVRFGFEQLGRIMQMWNRANQDVTFDHEVLATRVLGRNTAIIAANATTSQDAMLFWTWVTERTSDGWQIVYEHESWAGCQEPRTHPGMEGVPVPTEGQPDAGESAAEPDAGPEGS